ncbi:MAG TPA: FAD-linked oxidase C-terminal domain-containing protein [Trebonia sp.]|jgi:glycolate oxidase|nr:FAD-linked oxidase C-terminal domain-containing protein [Trebonia sp.]
MAALDIGALASRLSSSALVTDPQVTEAYRRDRAAIVPAGRPRAVVRAADVSDVSAALAWATANGVPVVPRGAGTGLSGGANAIDGCLMLTLEGLTAIREVNARDQYAVVEAGVLNAAVGRAATAAGLFYPPDPGSFEISTIGGNLATNAGGMRCVKYGVTRDSALGLEAVLADGTVLRTGSGTRKNVAGYDLTSLLIGSEGTLGVITSATLRLRPLPPVPPVTFVAAFTALPQVGDAVGAIYASGAEPSLLEFIDNPTINAIEDYRRMDLDRSAAGLLIGQADGAAADDDVRRMMKCCEKAGADLVMRSANRAESDLLLEARRLAGTAVMATGPTVIDDVCVPPGQLTRMLEAVQRVSEDSGLTIAVTAHAGDGNLHPALLLPDLTDRSVARALDAGERLCQHAVGLGGTITGEHGVGALKQPWLSGQLDPAALAAHRAIKAALDPAGILNPGRGF